MIGTAGIATDKGATRPRFFPEHLIGFGSGCYGSSEVCPPVRNRRRNALALQICAVSDQDGLLRPPVCAGPGEATEGVVKATPDTEAGICLAPEAIGEVSGLGREVELPFPQTTATSREN